MIGLPCTLAALLPLVAGEAAAPPSADAPKPARVIVILGDVTAPAPAVPVVNAPLPVVPAPIDGRIIRHDLAVPAPRTDRKIFRSAISATAPAATPADPEMPITLRAKDQPLREVLAVLRETTRQTIVLDPKAIAERGITPDTRISVDVRDAKLLDALKAVAESLGLECRLDGNAFLLAGRDDGLVTKTYYAADLVSGPAAQWTLYSLAKTASEIVAPGTWKPINDDSAAPPEQVGTIAPFFLNGSLIVRHNKEVHAQFAALFRALRKAQQGEEKTEQRGEPGLNIEQSVK